MGLAASQARFLNLVARKTNIEYEGQQINQQRTTLANQSANWYNSMLTISVPTPPSTDSFKTIVYTVDYGNESYNISQITPNGQGTYTVAYSATTTELKLTDTVAKYSITQDASGDYSTNGKQIVEITDDVQYVNDIKTAMGLGEDDKLFQYNKGSEAAPNYVYFSEDMLSSAVRESKPTTGKAYQDVTVYTTGAWSDTTINRDGNNRIASISNPSLNNGEPVAVNSTVVTDDMAYEEAYNDYKYQTYLYEQELENINAQTSIIQAQDKKLELRLKQLDTEQSAISQEMDSISNVIKKNVEESFKTFA